MSKASTVMGAGLRTGEEEEGAPSVARSETEQVGPELKGPLEIDDDAEPEPAPVTKNEDYESGTSDGGSDASGSSSTATVSCHALSSSGEEAIADSVGGRAHGLTSMSTTPAHNRGFRSIYANIFYWIFVIFSSSN